MEVKRRYFSAPNVGGLSLIMVFSILCLTIFAVLSLVTATNEYTLAKKYAASVQAYYNADYKACVALEDIKNGLQAKGIDNLAFDEEKATFSVIIDKNQTLVVSAVITNNDIKIISWETNAVGTQHYDSSLPVWDGEEGVLP